MAEKLEHDDLAFLEFRTGEVVARQAGFIAPHGSEGLHILGSRGAEELFDRRALRSGAGSWAARTRMATGCSENETEDNEETSHSRLRIGGCLRTFGGCLRTYSDGRESRQATQYTFNLPNHASSSMTSLRLCINIDHVATLRQARRGTEPDPVTAARACEAAGADGITAHLREDRRHIQDADAELILRAIRTPFNLEMACTGEMLDIAVRLRPHQVTLVPEKREEITTEGGLDVTREPEALRSAIRRLKAAGIRTSLFVDAIPMIIERSAWLEVDAIELHTGAYANAPDDPRTIGSLRAGARQAAALGLAVHAGHGLTVTNVAPVASIAEVEELNIGHSIVSHAVFDGLAAAVGAMRTAMDAARSASLR